MLARHRRGVGDSALTWSRLGALSWPRWQQPGECLRL